MRKILSITILVLASNLIFGQVNPKKCMTTKLVKEELKNNPEYELMRQNLVNYHQEHKNDNSPKQAVITIPVVIHVIHRTTHNIGIGTNISNEQIEDQLRILNEDYSKTNPEFPNPPRNTFVSLAGNPELQFCLATIDPNGNPTTGITRTPTTKTGWDYDTENNDMKQASTGGIDNWDPLRYLNIWVCNITNASGGGQTLGYAYLPGLQGSSSQSWKDGLVVDYQYFGTTGSVSSFSDGRTATHEIGHYLGLNHTFCEDTDSQGNPICCDNDINSYYSWGDVDDTPATKDIYYGSVTSSTSNNTCNDLSYSNAFTTNVLDMDENYMSYAANTWMFSQGQVDVMLGTLNASTFQGGRLNLKNSTVTVNCSNIIAASWDCNNQGICTDPGTGNGSYSSYNACVNACNCIGQSLPLSEGFQNGSVLPANWSIINNDNDKTWEITNLAGYNSTSSIYVNNSDYSANGQVDDLVLSTLNLPSSSSVNLRFDYAYSLWTDPTSNPNFSDTLQVWVSSDCGNTWQQIWEKAGINLVTSTPIFTGAAWVPSSNSQWASETINLNNYINQQDFVVKFRNITDYENNLFLDNINISSNSSTSIDEEIQANIIIYPNPADNQININHQGLKEIYNMLGKKVLETYDNQINISKLSKGVYTIKIENTPIRLIKK